MSASLSVKCPNCYFIQDVKNVCSNCNNKNMLKIKEIESLFGKNFSEFKVHGKKYFYTAGSFFGHLFMTFFGVVFFLYIILHLYTKYGYKNIFGFDVSSIFGDSSIFHISLIVSFLISVVVAIFASVIEYRTQKSRINKREIIISLLRDKILDSDFSNLNSLSFDDYISRYSETRYSEIGKIFDTSIHFSSRNRIRLSGGYHDYYIQRMLKELIEDYFCNIEENNEKISWRHASTILIPKMKGINSDCVKLICFLKWGIRHDRGSLYSSFVGAFMEGYEKWFESDDGKKYRKNYL